MWPLAQPHVSARTVFRACVNGARAEAKARLEPLEDAISDAAERYDAAARIAGLHTLGDLKDQPNDEEIRRDLAKNYTTRLARGAGRSYYDHLKARAPYGTCPLCGHRDVSTLDHQLPKSVYPLLATAPCNLVPACSVCNHAKGDGAPTRSEEQTLHPYYDDVDRDQWLFARIIQTQPAAVEFYVDPPSGWDQVLVARARLHFDTFKLASLYGPQSAREMAGNRDYLSRLLEAGGEAEVCRYLEDMARSCAAQARNWWKTAMYQALASNTWYISGGLAQQ